MTELNTNYPVKLRVLSPVHIGAGPDKSWQRGFDFVERGTKVYVLDNQRLIESMSEQLLKNYTDTLTRGKWGDVDKLLKEHVDLPKVAAQVFEYEGKPLSNEIKPLQRDGRGRPYIPGSSLKGAIVSAVFHYLHKHVGPERYNRFINKDLLGDFDQSIMRFIRPTDVEIAGTGLSHVSLFNLYADGSAWESDWKDGFQINLEHFETDARGEFRLTIANGLGEFFRKIEAQVRRPLLPKYYNQTIKKDAPGEYLFGLINACSRDHLQREIDFFTEFDQAEDTDMILAQLRRLEKMTDESPRVAVLRMSGNIGFHAITGDWRFKDHRSPVRNPDKDNMAWSQTERQKVPARYKSRKVLGRGDELLLGFVRLEI